jgi:ABC-type dipeptide/oligopeptide/nickel transport system permease subunit
MDIKHRLTELHNRIRPTLSELRFTLRRIRKSPLSIVGIVIVVFFAAVAILAPVLAPPVDPRDPYSIFHDGYAPTPKPPGSPVLDTFVRSMGWTVHYFGTAEGQLDIYYGCIWGTRTAFRIGVLVVAISLAVGILVGCISGYYGGIIDELLMRFTDIVLAFPGLVLAMALIIGLPASWSIDLGFVGLAIAAFFGPFVLGNFYPELRSGLHKMHARLRKNTKPASTFYPRLRGMWAFVLGLSALTILFIVYIQVLGISPFLWGQTGPYVLTLGLTPLDKVLIALALVGWPGYTRVIRGEILRIRQEDYVEASKAVGCSDFRIITRHILPNAIYPVVIMASLDIGSVVLTAAALSFLGIGATTGYADWGQMISFARNWIWAGLENPWQYWYAFIIPGLFIFAFVLGWNLLGDAFRDILDPTLRRK